MMVRHASVFSQLVAIFNQAHFHNLVFNHKVEHYRKAFTNWDHFIAMFSGVRLRFE